MTSGNHVTPFLFFLSLLIFFCIPQAYSNGKYSTETSYRDENGKSFCVAPNKNTHTSLNPTSPNSEQETKINFINFHKAKRTVKFTLRVDSEDTIKLNVFESYVRPYVNAVDSTGWNLTYRIKKTGIVDTSIIGIYSIKYSVWNNSNDTINRIITYIVEDNKRPSIKGRFGPTITSPINESFNIQDHITIWDNYSDSAFLYDNLIEMSNNVDIFTVGTYSIIVKTKDVSGNWSNFYTLNIKIVNTLNIIEPSVQSNITLHPNPAFTLLKVQSNSVNIESISITNNLGQLVFDYSSPSHTSEFQISFANLCKGLYYVRVQSANQITTKKIWVK